MPKKKLNSFLPDQILDEVSKKKFHPIYFLIGEEDWYFDLIIDEIINQAVDKNTGSFNFDFLYGTEVTIEKIYSIATSFPMMAHKRIIIVKEFEKCAKSESENEILEKYILNPLESTILVLSSKEAKGKKKIFNTLLNKSVVVECNTLYDNEVTHWIRKRVKQKSGIINEDALRLLQSNVGNNLRELDNAIDKLFLIKSELNEINEEHVESVIGVSKEFTPFELASAIGEKQISKAFSILHYLLEQGKSGVEIIPPLVNHFQKLLKLSGLIGDGLSKDEIAKALRTPIFFLGQYQMQLKNYSIRELENAMLQLALADEKLKSVTTADESRTMILAISSIIKGI